MTIRGSLGATSSTAAATATATTSSTKGVWNPAAGLAAPTRSIRPLVDATQTVLSARRYLKASIKVIDQIKNKGDGTDGVTRTALDSARFHAIAGLALIEDYLRHAYTVFDNVLAVPGLLEALENHAQALRQADVIPAAPVITAPGLGAADIVSDVVNPTVYNYLGLGLAALGALLIWRAVR